MIPDNAIKPIRNPNGRDNTEIAVGTLIAYRVFPQTQEGIQQAKDTIAANNNWVVPSLLPEYYDGIDSDLMVGKENDSIRAIRETLKQFYGLLSSSAGTEEFIDTTVYTPADKFVDDGKEFALKIETDLEDALEKTSDEIMDSIDEILRQDQEKFEEFKRKQEEELKKKIEKLNTPERVSQELTIKIPPAHYIQGTAGRWQPEFENDIDHAVYFAGKSPLPKGAKQREVLDWLKSLGLTFEQIHSHREKVLDQIRKTIALPGVEEEYPYVYIDAVDQDFQLRDNEEEENPEGLDDLLGEIRDETEFEKQEQEEQEELEEQVSVAVDTLEQADEAKQEVIEEDLLDDLPDSVKESLIEILNKRKRSTSTKEKKSSSITNAKIYNFLTTNLIKIQNQFESIDRSIQKQNEILSANFASTSSMIQSMEAQNSLLIDRIDALTQEYKKQNQYQKDLLDQQENIDAEKSLENIKDTAGTEGFVDTTKGNKKKSVPSHIAQYFKRQALRKLYRKMPGGLRKARIGYKKLQRKPRILRQRIAGQVSSRLPTSVRKSMSTLSKVKGAGSVARNLGPAKYAFAGMEYAERKKAGQSNLQATAGVGVGLAAASAAGAAGAKGGAIIGTFLGGPIGTAIGTVVGGLGGAIIGGILGSKASDVVTGVHETGGETKPGIATLHGTELIINKNNQNNTELYNPEATIARALLGATVGYVNQAGPAAASLTPVIKQLASPLIKQYGMPNILVQSDFGGAIPPLESTINGTKKPKTAQEELSELERSLLEEQNPQTFAEKLMKMLDPEGRFQQLLKQIGSGDPSPDAYDGSGIVGDLKGNIVNPMEAGEIQDYPGAKFGAPREGGRKHKGRDIVGTPGMKFSAALPGTVTNIIEVADLPGGGVSKGIYVKHDNGMETRYLHVKPSVKVGDTVKAGQKLGTITDTDNISSVPHLHFEVIVKGTHVDPEPLLKGAFKIKDISAGKVPGLTIENYDGTKPPENKPQAAQEISQNYGKKVGERIYFPFNNKEFNAYKTRTGWDIYDGPTKLDTSNGKNSDVVKAFTDHASTQMPRDTGTSPDLTGTDFQRERGGPVAANTPYIVGEAGPELFVPKENGFVINNQQTAGLVDMVDRMIFGKPNRGPSTVRYKSGPRDAIEGIGGKYYAPYSPDPSFKPVREAMLDKNMYSKPSKDTSLIATNLDQSSDAGQYVIVNQQSQENVASNITRPFEVNTIRQGQSRSNKDHNNTIRNIVMQRLVG